MKSEMSLIVFVCLGEGVDSLGATADEDAAVDGGNRDPPLDVFSVSSADTKDFSLSDAGDSSRVALPVTREGIGVLRWSRRFQDIALLLSKLTRCCKLLPHASTRKQSIIITYSTRYQQHAELHDIKGRPIGLYLPSPGVPLIG